MAETTWTEEVAEPPKKKGIPVWVWGCGGGCLLVLVLALVATVFLVNVAKDAMDPEVVWPKVAEVLPFDERPNYKALGSSGFGMEGYFLAAEEKELLGFLFVTEASEKDRKDLEQLFAGEISGGVAGLGELQDAKPVSITVKGRPCRALSFVNRPPAFLGKEEGNEVPTLLIDLSRDPNKFVMLQLFCSDGEADQGDVDAFFEPFDPWR